MQAKSVLTALSLSILCSTTAFGMMPRLSAVAMRQLARQAGTSSLRSGMRPLLRNGTPRRFFSDFDKTPKEKRGTLFTPTAEGIYFAGQCVVYGSIAAAVIKILTS